ncbi:MAG: M20/M25/M40 family metallo-hydrolase [Trueperaceae bacterium]|nr:MAG: M20/M25/M40 family metallo-hydrolase [Trueperaceae bacterium]
MIPTDRIVHWLSELIQIPSVGPENAGPRAGVPGEAAMVEALERWLGAFGADVNTEEVEPGRYNLYAVLEGSSDRWQAVDVHTDTVGVETMTIDPFTPFIRDGRIYGRGATDDKASLAIVLAAFEQLQNQSKPPPHNLLLCASAIEETGCKGAPVFANWLDRKSIRPDELLVAEPTLCAPVYGHKGSGGIEITVKGVAAHTSIPEEGKNAISAAAELILALGAEHVRLRSLEPTTEVGTASLTVSLIRGGEARNIVPPTCTLSVDRRVVPGEDPDEVARALERFAAQTCSQPITVSALSRIPAFYQPPGTAWQKRLADWSGQPPGVVPYGTNAFAYPGSASEVIVFGPGSIDDAHRDDESIAIHELERAAHVYERWWQLPKA